MEKVKQLEVLIRRYKLNNFFGSKRVFESSNPNSNPLYNVYTLVKDDYGILQKISFNYDIDLNDKESLDNLRKLGNELKEDFYIYRESTVHNQTFNGRIFPYDSWVIKYEYRSEELSIRENY